MTDPERLLDSGDAPEELLDLLSAARDDLPSAQQLAGLEARLGPQLAAPTGGAAAGGVSAKVLGGVLALLLAGGGAALYAGGVFGGEAGVAPSAAAEADLAAAEQPAPSTAAVADEPAGGEPAPADATEPEATQPSEVTADSAEHEGAAKTKTTAKPTAAKPSEASLLSAARAAVESNPNRALALTRQHAALYPSGLLAQEREAIAVEALAKLGRAGEAKRKAVEFEKKYPDSVHKKRVDRASDP